MNQDADQSDRSRYGTVHKHEDGYQLRFERQLPHPVEKVWAALTNPAHRAQWLAPGEIELTLGGRVYLAFTDGDSVIDGRVTAIAPPRLLEFSWTDQGNDLGFVRWELMAADGRYRRMFDLQAKRFEATMDGVSAAARERFYSGNFAEMMGMVAA